MILDGKLDASVQAAAAALQRGELLGLPTETVYGLAADSDNDAAVAQIFTAKGRPANHPLIVHVADAAAMTRYAKEVPVFAQQLIDAFLGQQRLAISAEYPHRKFLAFAAKALIGHQRLGRALAKPRVGFVVQQWLLQGQGRGIAAVVAVAGDITCGHLRLVARIVVAPRQIRQQRRPTYHASLFTGLTRLDGGLKSRVIAQRQVVRIQQPQGLRSRCKAHAQGKQQRLHSSTKAIWVRSSKGLNR